MSLTSRVVSWLLKLPPAETHHYTVRRDVRVPMPDGVTLLADHYVPRSQRPCPTLLIRTPYGRRGFFAATFALPFVARGYQVFMQSCRGTAGSGGDFFYARNERADGLATIAWIKRQEWFSGQLAMIGGSYLGFVQWAVAAEAGDDIQAMVPSITSADFNHFRYQGGSVTLESMLGWSTMMTEQAASGLRMGNPLGVWARNRRLEQAYLHLPLSEADRVVIQRPSRPFQSAITHAPDDAYWNPVDFSARVGEVSTPICLQAGWYDLFLDWQLKDYQALRAAGRQPYLLIGPWYHGQLGSVPVMTRDALAWLNARVKGDSSGLRSQPVRLFVMGAKTWRDFADWPPPAQQQRWHLQPNRALATVSPPESAPDQYRYDPADPTPAVGGNSLGSPRRMGPKDNRRLEARRDVLVYTTAPLTRDLLVIGPVTADLYVQSSLDHTDFFVRLCAVERSGKSVNLCDGILRLAPETADAQTVESGGIRHVQIALWPTAYHFRQGQRIRVQVSSGAHPRFARNLGSGEPVASGAKLIPADQAVYHDPAHPSAMLLPV
ncbi:MAG: CocE/NonD family hydrolase, partial [Nitrososphaerota archaeon]